MRKNLTTRQLYAEAREAESWEAYCLEEMEDEVCKEDRSHRFNEEYGFLFLEEEAPYISYYLDEDGNPINVQERIRFLGEDLVVEEL